MSWITDVIQDHRNGRIGEDEMIEKLASAKYPAPKDAGRLSTAEAYAQSDPGDGDFEDGTYEEVQKAYYGGLLTRDQFYAINNQVAARGKG